MNRFSLKILTLLLYLACTLGIKAQKFDYIDTKGYTIHSMFKDSRGILWLGTNDGIMTYAQLLSQSPTGFTRTPQLNGLVVAIEEDQVGRLLLRLQSNKYMIYDPKSNKVIKQVDQYFQQLGIPVQYDFNIDIDRQGNYWIGGKNDLYLYSPKSHQHHHFSLPAKGGNIVCIDAKRPKDIAIVCEKEVYLFHKQSHRATWLCHQPEAYNHQFFYIQSDSRGNFYLASSAKLHRFDIRKREWRNYDQTMFDISQTRILDDDNLLVPTSNTGAFIFDRQGNERKHLLPSPTTGLINKHLLNSYYDADNKNIWLIYHKQGLAVSRYATNNYRLHILPSPNGQSANDIIGLAEDRSHNLYMGTEDNGAYKLSAYGENHIYANQQPNHTAVCVFCDSRGRIWTGLYRFGLKCSDGSSYFYGFSPYSIVEGPDGCLFVSLMGLGLWKINPTTHQTTLVEDENLWLMQCVKKGDMLYTASTKYIHCINMRTGKKRQISAAHFGNSNFNAGIKSLCIDRRGWLWLVNYASYSETDIYDTKHNKCFTTNALRNYVVNSVVEDKDGNLWFGTSNGIVRLKVDDAEKHKFSTNSYFYGTQKNQYYNERCALCLSDGRLLFGATDGYMLFDPREIARRQHKERQPSLIFTSLRINSQYVNPQPDGTKDAICTGDFSFVKSLNLKYNQNNLVLEFCPRNELHNNFEKYYYKIEGIHREWMPLNNYQIVLPNLPPGTYKLLMREQPTQRPSESIEYEALTITIHPPFWLSWYAYLLYIMLIGGIFYFIYRYRTNRRRYIEKMKMVRLQAQHEQEMNDMKLQFFTNVSHDLRTPLTLIITPLEEMVNTVGDTKLQNILATMLRNAKRLFVLVNQILDIRALDLSATKVINTRQDIIELLQREYQSFQSIAASRKIDFRLEANVEHLMMDTDADKVTKMVENLLSNAFKYTQDGGEITIHAQHADNQLRISITDNGRGVSDDEKKNIFEPFYLGKDSNRKESSGLGLSIVKQFAKQLGGNILLEDNHPKGSVFTIVLPATATTTSLGTQPKPVEATASKDEATPSQDRKTLLLVEDNIDLLQYLSSTLSATYNIY